MKKEKEEKKNLPNFEDFSLKRKVAERDSALLRAWRAMYSWLTDDEFLIEMHRLGRVS